MAAKLFLTETANLLHFSRFSVSTQQICSKCRRVTPRREFPQIRLCSTAPPSTSSSSNVKGDLDEQDAATRLPPVQEFREKFIPISRRSLVRLLIQEKNFLTGEQQRKFEEFAVCLDNAIFNQYHSVLSELKHLFDPLNPDTDTLAIKNISSEEEMDNEFWLLQKMASVMEKANFHELSRHQVDEALAVHAVGEGVMVSVNTKNYDVLKFWALGKGSPTERKPWYTRLASGVYYKVTKQTQPNPIEYYKRVVVAVRTKKSSVLILKMFKEVPVTALEQLLPDGKIQMTRLDQGILATTITVGGLSLIVKSVSYLADVKLQWTLIAASVTGLVALRAWTSYKNRRTRYMMQLSRMLYFKNIANNRGLLTLLVDRAEDEALKEALILYSFLLTCRTHRSLPTEDDSSTALSVIGGLPVMELEHSIEKWIEAKTGASIRFDGTNAIKLLQDFGILINNDDQLGVVALETALLSLPRQPVSILNRTNESDLEESYDRVFFEDNAKYRSEEKQQRKHGWK